jgi:glycosyltransferase involved in cell wall biosynthesis
MPAFGALTRTSAASRSSRGRLYSPPMEDSAPSADGTLPVSVCIPAYQAGRTLGRAIDSARAQRHLRPAEILVVDDGSTDDTAAVAERHGARLIRHEGNRGLAATRNTLLQSASQPWLAYMDADDEWLPNLLEDLWPLTDGHVLVSGAGLARTDDPSNDFLSGWPSPRPRRLTPGFLASYRNFVGPSSQLVRKDMVAAAGGSDEQAPRIGSAEDLDLWIRVLEQGPGVVVGRIVAIYHLAGPGAASVQTDRALMLKAYEDFIASVDGRPWATRRVLERARGVIVWDRLRAAMREGRRAAIARYAAELLTHPERAAGAVAQVVYRRRCTRYIGRVSHEGRPTAAVLPGAMAPPERDHEARIDLRSAGEAEAMLRLARRPTRRAYAGSRRQALAARALGVQHVELAHNGTARPAGR